MKKVKTYIGPITTLQPRQIYVFGSNTQGRHGKGSALIARLHFGAIYGKAEGLQGQSYAIITKDLTKRIHPSRTVEQICHQIEKLYKFAVKHSHLEFFIVYTAQGQNLNSYTAQEMADMFSSFVIPDNIVFEEEFSQLLYKHAA
jgi:hypothetical protein